MPSPNPEPQDLNAPAGRIDVHCHLLPGVDDGCQYLGESLACARELVSVGYTHCFCTPHIWPNLPRNRTANIAVWTQRLQHELDQAQIPLRLLPGGELNLNRDIRSDVHPRELVTYGLARRHLILDIWADALPDFFDPAVRWLQEHGLTVILAHPERMRVVQEAPALLDRFQAMGMLFQGNLQCFADPPDSPTYRLAERFLKDGRYFMLGSDLHNLATWPVRLAGLRRAIELGGERIIWTLTRDNPRSLLPDC